MSNVHVLQVQQRPQKEQTITKRGVQELHRTVRNNARYRREIKLWVTLVAVITVVLVYHTEMDINASVGYKTAIRICGALILAVIIIRLDSFSPTWRPARKRYG